MAASTVTLIAAYETAMRKPPPTTAAAAPQLRRTSP